MLPLETDPLLPQGRSAPEISGFGFSRPSEIRRQTQGEVTDQSKRPEDKDNEQASQVNGGSSPLRILSALFIIVVGLAVLVALLVPGTRDAIWPAPRKSGSSIWSKVDKVLSENPLIGL